jgi:hypothetical protein
MGREPHQLALDLDLDVLTDKVPAMRAVDVPHSFTFARYQS